MKLGYVILLGLSLVGGSAAATSDGAVKPLEHSAVLKAEGVSASALYSTAEQWIVKTIEPDVGRSLVQTRSMIEVRDRDAGLLVGKVGVPYKPHLTLGPGGMLWLRVKVQIKEGRYKVSFYDFKHEGINKEPCSFGRLTTIESPDKAGIKGKSCPLMQGGRDKEWEDLKGEAKRISVALGKSLKKAMGDAKSEEDW